MIKSVICAAVLLALSAPVALAQADKAASAAEKKQVQDAIAKVGCKAVEIEKERDGLFEVDDATCEIGQ